MDVTSIQGYKRNGDAKKNVNCMWIHKKISVYKYSNSFAQKGVQIP
jgi:hypothetical protein